MVILRINVYFSTIVGVKPRTAITFETNLICGNKCFEHTDGQTSIMEINRQYAIINETMNIYKVGILEYNQTSVLIYQEEGPVVYTCKKRSYVLVFQKRNLTLCSKSYHYMIILLSLPQLINPIGSTIGMCI